MRIAGRLHEIIGSLSVNKIALIRLMAPPRRPCHKRHFNDSRFLVKGPWYSVGKWLIYFVSTLVLEKPSWPTRLSERFWPLRPSPLRSPIFVTRVPWGLYYSVLGPEDIEGVVDATS